MVGFRGCLMCAPHSVGHYCSCVLRETLHSPPLTFFIAVTLHQLCMVLQVYTDASRGEFVSGLGYIVEGDVNVSGNRVLDGQYTSMEAEFYALVEGLRIASVRSEQREYCEAYSDAKPLTKKMRGSQRCSDEWQDYRTSYEWLAGKFDTFELNYCPRECNEDAHELAREALVQGRSR